MSDHLAKLCMRGEGSSGQYTPHAFDLRLRGTEQPADHIVYLHEVHHAALNDMTAWGTALHVYARLPDAGAVFRPLLDACRTTHESLATFASVQIASARHGLVDSVLGAYPAYVPLYETTVRLTTAVDGASRRQLISNALARLCMQTPILDAMMAVGAEAFHLGRVRDIDRPDGRWRWLVRQGPDLPGAAASAADRAVTAEFGPAALHSDGGDLYTSTGRSHDEAWDHWEATAYEHLRTALASTRAQTLPLNGHQDATARLLALLHDRYGDLGLRAEMTDGQRRDDSSVAISVLQQVRHDHTGDGPHRAHVLPPMTAADLVDLLGDRPVVDGRPAIIVDARPPARLAALYRWPDNRLPDGVRRGGEPVVAVRLFADDDQPGTAIAHVVLPDPEALNDLARHWQERGAFVLCVSASCFVDQAWARRWLLSPGRRQSLFVLVDVEPTRFVPTWVRDGREVLAIGVDVTDTGGRRGALLFTADQGEVWWLVVADDITVQLVLQYLRGQLGALLRSETEQFATIREATRVAIAHVLATESFTSFDALEAADDT